MLVLLGTAVLSWRVASCAVCYLIDCFVSPAGVGFDLGLKQLDLRMWAVVLVLRI